MVESVTGKMQFDERRVIMLAQAGDYEAFAVIVQHYRLPVIQVVFRMCANSHLAEDAAQEAFIRCWKHLPQYQFTGSFRA